MNAKKIILYVVLLIVAVNVALMAVVFKGAMIAPPSAQVPPNPNGRDDFVKAEKMALAKPAAYTDIKADQLRAIVAANAPALAVVRTGLGRQCLVPLDDLKWHSEDHLAQLNNFKPVILAFFGEATLAEVEHRPGVASDIWLEELRFSHAFCRGGAYIDSIVSRSGENFGLTHLLKLTPSMNAKDCTRIAKALEDIDSQSDTLEQVVAQEKIYAGKLSLHQSFSQLIHFRGVRRMNENFATNFNAEVLERRAAIVNIAGRAYELDKGKRPGDLAVLVPAYLKTVPQDPVTGMNLKYKP